MLSSIFTTACATLSLARRLTLTHDQLSATPDGRINAHDSPEDVDTHLRRAGLSPVRDLGTVPADLRELRENLGGRRTEEIYTGVHRGGDIIWYARSIRGSHQIRVTGPDPLTGQPDGRPDGRPDALRDRQPGGLPDSPGQQDISQPGPLEEHLRRLTTVDHPLQPYIYQHNEELFALAHATGSTPDAVQRYLNGGTDEPELAPAAELCPERARCPAGCAVRQQDGRAERPLTVDGTHRSCTYWQFLTTYGRQPTEFREAAADRMLDTLIGANTRRGQKGSSTASSNEAETEELSTDGAGNNENSTRDSRTGRPEHRGENQRTNGTNQRGDRPQKADLQATLL